jgi:hypothetical protein
MKQLLVILTAALVGLSSNAAINQEDKPTDREVQVGLSSVFVPGSFDSNSEAYVIVGGVFQNGCYKWNRAERTTRDEFTHEVKSIATVTPGMCIMVLIPFQKEVRLGKLSAGKHTVRFLNGDGTYLEKSLNVE